MVRRMGAGGVYGWTMTIEPLKYTYGHGVLIAHVGRVASKGVCVGDVSYRAKKKVSTSKMFFNLRSKLPL